MPVLYARFFILVQTYANATSQDQNDYIRSLTDIANKEEENGNKKLAKAIDKQIGSCVMKINSVYPEKEDNSLQQINDKLDQVESQNRLLFLELGRLKK